VNKNIIIVGVMAAGLYLLSQANKQKKIIAKKKAPQRPKRKYPKPHPYVKPKIKKAVLKKKPIYHKPKIKRVIARKKQIYHKLKPRVAILKKQILKRMARRKR